MAGIDLMPNMGVALDSVGIEQRISSYKNRSEVVIYYRKPMQNIDGSLTLEQGWIVWSDSQIGKRADLLTRGFEPLPHFGRVWDEDPHFQKYGPWGIILSRPNGPQAFPADQVLAYRWYDPRKLGQSGAMGKPFPNGTMCEACGQVHRVRFPQLEGVQIVEYDCPECNDRTFFEPIHMARHLRNSHDYERHEINALGVALGIDFSKLYARGGKLERTYTMGPVEDDELEDEVPAYNRQSVQITSARAEGGVQVLTPLPEVPKPKRVLSQKTLDALAAGRAKSPIGRPKA